MDDNKNQNQPNQAAADYQKILNEYASSVKPEDANPDTESKKPETDLNITTSLKEAPVKPEENKIPEIKPDITENIPKKPAEAYLKGINSPQIESPIHPSLAANLEENDITPVSTPKYDQLPPTPAFKPEENVKPVENNPEPAKTTTESPIKPLESESSQPEKTPEEIKAEINRLLEDDTKPQDSSDSLTPKSGSSMGKVFFVFALVLFLAVAAGLAYFLFLSPSDSNNSNNTNNSITPTITPTENEAGDNTTNSGSCDLNGKTYQVGESFQSADGCNTCSCSSAGVITCTEKACAGTPTVTSATKSATVTSTTKTAFQKMIINWNLYKDISVSERVDLSGTGDWMGSVKSTDSLYPFVQKMLKGSYKKLTISKENLNTIKGNYSYTFYLTPNYEKWSNEKFQSDFIPEYSHSGIFETFPLYAYSDKLVWGSYSCGGVISTDSKECDSLVKEIKTAFP